MKVFSYFVFLCAVIVSFIACNDDEKFSNDRSLRLDFSSDTIRFDTVFTTVRTSTRTFKVYNRNSDALLINSVKLMNADNSGFRMRVDGESGNEVNNVKILAEDSIYVMLETTIDPLNQNNPLLIEDSIRFQVNGVNQYVMLEAIGQDVTIWKNKIITQDTIITGKKPFLIYNTLEVKKGVTLTIEKNVSFYFHAGSKLLVEGTLIARGTIQEPIRFGGDRTDYLFSNVPYDRVPGQWYGIQIATSSYDNQFENVRIRNGIYGVLVDKSESDKTKATFLNTVIQNTTKEGLSATNAKIDAKNSLFANAGTYAVYLMGGDYNFLQCTIANYLLYPGLYRKGTMHISESEDASLRNLSFINTIISGSTTSESEIKLEFRTNFTSYKFINCLLKVGGEDDANFINTVWNEDPSFEQIYRSGETKQPYYYNFELSENSPAINKASREYSAQLPYDLRGVSRLENGPDIGCFEWKAQ